MNTLRRLRLKHTTVPHASALPEVAEPRRAKILAEPGKQTRVVATLASVAP